MALEILTDPRLRRVKWRDLVPTSRVECVLELALSVPWLVASIAVARLASAEPLWYLLALPLSYMFFLAALRQVHDAHHYALDIGRLGSDLVSFVLSVVLLGSNHAGQVAHLLHHKHCLDEGDIEGASARLSWWRALLLGPLFPIRVHMAAMKSATRRQRRWIVAELAANALVIGWALTHAEHMVLRYHVAAMAVGQCLTAFFAVWTVHHDCDRSHFIARTLRNRWKSTIAMGMFFHIEHHLFPRVPTCHLPELARRLDEVAPELSSKQVY